MLMEEMEGAVGTVGVAGGGAGSGSGAAMRGGAVPVGPLGVGTGRRSSLLVAKPDK